MGQPSTDTSSALPTATDRRRVQWSGVHGDDVAVGAVERLRQVDQAGLVEVLEEQRIAVERVVDAIVQVAVALRRHVGVEVLQQRLDALRGGPQLGDLGGIQEPGQVEIPVPFQRLDLLL